MTITGLTLTGYLNQVLPSALAIECPDETVTDCKAYDGYLLSLPADADMSLFTDYLHQLVSVQVRPKIITDAIGGKLISFDYDGKIQLVTDETVAANHYN